MLYCPLTPIWHYEYSCTSRDLLNGVRGHGNQQLWIRIVMDNDECAHSMTFHDQPFYMSFHAWEIPFSNSVTFQDAREPCTLCTR